MPFQPLNRRMFLRSSGVAIALPFLDAMGPLRAAETPRAEDSPKRMLRRDLSLGGEQSGHIIFSDYLFTGDGLATSLNVLRAMAATRRSLADLAAELTTYPQVLMNLRVREKVDLKTLPSVAEVMSNVESRLAGNGRLLVRYSGTEPLLRVMVEARDPQQAEACARRLAATVEAA